MATRYINFASDFFGVVGGLPVRLRKRNNPHRVDDDAFQPPTTAEVIRTDEVPVRTKKSAQDSLLTAKE